MTLEPRKGSGVITANPVPVTTNADPKPTRPYASQKNWDKIGQDLKKDLENEKPEGDAALNGLFK